MRWVADVFEAWPLRCLALVTNRLPTTIHQTPVPDAAEDAIDETQGPAMQNIEAAGYPSSDKTYMACGSRVN